MLAWSLFILRRRLLVGQPIGTIWGRKMANRGSLRSQELHSRHAGHIGADLARVTNYAPTPIFERV